jgi:hypothetical protein
MAKSVVSLAHRKKTVVNLSRWRGEGSGGSEKDRGDEEGREDEEDREGLRAFLSSPYHPPHLDLFAFLANLLLHGANCGIEGSEASF